MSDYDTLYFLLSNTDFFSDDKIFDRLVRMDFNRLKSLKDRLEKIDSIKNSKKFKGKSLQSKKSQLKGLIYEKLVLCIISGVTIFESHGDITSETNQLDVLVVLSNVGCKISPFKDWKTHFIIECKYHESHVSVEWANKLMSILQIHGAEVGVLITKKGMARTGRQEAKRAIQLMAAKSPKTIVLCLDWLDILDIVNGTNVLRILKNRYIETLAGIDKLLMLKS